MRTETAPYRAWGACCPLAPPLSASPGRVVRGPPPARYYVDGAQGAAVVAAAASAAGEDAGSNGAGGSGRPAPRAAEDLLRQAEEDANMDQARAAVGAGPMRACLGVQGGGGACCLQAGCSCVCACNRRSSASEQAIVLSDGLCVLGGGEGEGGPMGLTSLANDVPFAGGVAGSGRGRGREGQGGGGSRSKGLAVCWGERDTPPPACCSPVCCWSGKGRCLPGRRQQPPSRTPTPGVLVASSCCYTRRVVQARQTAHGPKPASRLITTSPASTSTSTSLPSLPARAWPSAPTHPPTRPLKRPPCLRSLPLPPLHLGLTFECTDPAA